MSARQKVAMVVAELMGAAVLASAVYAMVGRTTFPLFGGLAAGLTLGLLVHTIGSASGAHVNPAVTLGLWSVRKISTVKAVFYIAAQMLGGLAAWGLINYFMGAKLQSIAGEEFDWKILIAEATGTFIFAFGIASAIYQKYEGAKLAFTVGASLTIGILVASLGSNGVLNPAVAVGIQSWSWAYAVGPIVGAVLGMNVYALLFSDEVVIKRPVRAAVAAKTVTAKAAPKKKPAAKKSAAKKRK
jgi:glycerol uptake facilitator-like aquaporin